MYADLHGMLFLEPYCNASFKRNRVDAPLSRFPPEFRDKIWALTTGDQYIEFPKDTKSQDCTNNEGRAVLKYDC